MNRQLVRFGGVLGRAAGLVAKTTCTVIVPTLITPMCLLPRHNTSLWVVLRTVGLPVLRERLTGEAQDSLHGWRGEGVCGAQIGSNTTS